MEPDWAGASLPDGITPASVVHARRGLHAIAERVMAGPQSRGGGGIRLAVIPGGFSTTAAPAAGAPGLRVRRGELIRDPDGLTLPLIGTIAELSARFGIEPGAPTSAYPQASDLADDDHVDLTGGATQVVLRALEDGTSALREFVAQAGPGSGAVPILWPEHFDSAISLEDVNYGVSPGDTGHDLPYAYVGPWTPRQGAFWNEPFGASRPVHELAGVAGITSFFLEGRQHAATA